MNGRTIRTQLALGSILALADACLLERIDEPAPSGVPEFVQESLTRNCATAGCHSGSRDPNLSPGQTERIVGQQSAGGVPYVVFGDLESSLLIRRIFDEVNPMPPRTSPAMDEADRAIIVAWVAGVYGVPGDPVDPTIGETEDETEDDDASTMPTTMPDDDTGDETGGETESDSDADSDEVDVAFAPVQAIFNESCLVAGSCHETFPPLLTPGNAYGNIVGVPSTVQPYEGMTINYIEAGDPDASYLFHKLDGREGIAGTQMPSPSDPLSEADLAVIRGWIEDGALR